MRKELLKSVSPIPDKSQQQAAAFHEQSETVFIARVTREERVKNSRLIIAIVHEFRRNSPPSLKLRAGSRIKITTLPDVAEPVKKGGSDAKK